MTGLRKLASNLRQRVGELDKEANQLAIRTAETIVGDLVQVTPVDTSQALSNWQVGIGSPVDSSISPYFPGEHGSTQSASSAAALDAARALLRTKKPGQTIYISNVLRYIGRLNEGSSSQAPAGFVERAVLLGRKFVQNAKLGKGAR